MRPGSRLFCRDRLGRRKDGPRAGKSNPSLDLRNRIGASGFSLLDRIRREVEDTELTGGPSQAVDHGARE
jgi:hypothetical protein